MGRLREPGLVAAFAVVHLTAALGGRATVVGDDGLTLVWPAAGVGVLWLLSVVGRARLVSTVLLVVTTMVANVFGDATGGPAVVVTMANLVQVAAVVVLLRRWCPDLGSSGGRPPLESTASLLRFLLADAIGCLVGVLVGLVGLWAIGQPFAPDVALTWWGRNTCGILAVGTTGLLLIHLLRHRGRPHSAPGGTVEAVALVVSTGVLIAIDHASGTPFAFLLPATTAWAGLRFQPLLVSAHAALAGAAVIWLTLNGHGLFPAHMFQRTGVLMAQLFVGMTIMIGLFLAAARQQAERLQSQLRQGQSELAAFSRRAAHDLQSPLAVVEGWSTLLAGRLPSASSEVEIVHRIQSATSQMRRLVGDLLADAAARDRELSPEDIDLDDLVREVVDRLGATAVVHVRDLGAAYGDPFMLRQLFDNLLGNALKYVEPGTVPDVEVRASSDRNGTVTVRVSDRGVGIPDGSHVTVFGEFIRAHGDEYPGTGLGLSICRRIVERHGGAITAHSRRGGGTTVEFQLPRGQVSSPRGAVVRRTFESVTDERQRQWTTLTSSR